MNNRKARKIILVDTVYAAIYLAFIGWIIWMPSLFFNKLEGYQKVVVIILPLFLAFTSALGIYSAMQALKKNRKSGD